MESFLRDLREARDACNKLPFDDARACRCRRRRRHHRRVSPRRHASLHLTALELRKQTARSGRQSSGRPGGRCSAPSEPVRPRVPLPPPPPLHPIPVCRESNALCMADGTPAGVTDVSRVCVCVWTCHLSLYDS